MKEYLYTDQLAERTPWTEAAIRTMIARGIFKEGVHFFRPRGQNGRPIFKWTAIVELIEGGTGGGKATGETIPLASGAVVDLDEAATRIRRLHD